MVKVREDYPLDFEGKLDAKKWLDRITNNRNTKEIELINKAIKYAEKISNGLLTKYGEPCFEQSLIMAEILHSLGMDSNTIAASIIYGPFPYIDFPEKNLAEMFNDEVAKLILTLAKVDEAYKKAESRIEHSTIEKSDFLSKTMDNLRNMFLGLSQDIRAILIKLSQHLSNLRFAKNISKDNRRKLAIEAKKVFAPVANRLGIGQLKWEIEDLAFRYLEPTTYKNIAKLLDEKRIDREKYINLVVDNLEKTLEKHNIKAKVYGRVKHIYSIWRKMLRKKLDYAEIYDVRAIRIIVNEVSECYGVLGIVHSLWEHIPKEFDDYIARPKPNGYQSLHTAVIGPDGKVIEIQIRTKKMDEISELGVASHWRYKEKVKYDIGYEEKLSLLRKALNWQEELVVSQDAQEGVSIEDRVYVFTPQGDVVDLPYGSTPLDFAYKIHTDIGHRCRGAKLNGKIATLNTKLESGTLVEILTAKKGEPSRDWLNPNLGFVKTVRARSKIQSWFKKQDREQNIHDGRELLSKELKRLGIFNVNIKEIITGLSDINTEDDFYAAIAVGDVRISQVLGIVQKLVKAKTGESQAIISEENIVKSRQDLSKTPAFKISIQGIGNLVHHFAKCCKPNPSDEIIGYITMNGSVSIHKRDCINILQARKNKQNRLIEVIWGHHKQKKYFKIKLNIKAYKRRGLLKDISNVLETEDIDLLSIKSSVKEDEHLVFFHFIIEVPSFTKLEAILSKIQQLQNVVDVYREVES